MSEAALAAVVKRLEAATTRLEEIAKVKTGSPAGSVTGGSTGTASAAGGAPAVAAFQELLDGPFEELLKLCAKIGGVVEEQSTHVREALHAQKTLIETAAASKKPDTAGITELLKPLQAAMGKVSEIREKNRASPLFNHLSTVSEGFPALGWVVIEPAPAPYVSEMRDASQFYANRVMKEYKDKDPMHVEWVKSYVGFLTELHGYVKKWHTTGLTWNPRGGDAKSFSGSAPAATAAAPASAPAPQTTAAPAAGGKPAGLFSELNKADLTSGLRKVDKSEMTHKNPELRAGSVVKAEERPAASAPAKFGGAAPKAPPKLALEGNKWAVENQNNNQNIVIDKTELKHTVYIFNCQNSTIQVKGKVNAVTLDGCKKVGLVVENAVSTIDVVNCKSAQVQITGKAPTVVIDKTDGLQLYLSKTAQAVEILTAKSSEMNVLVEGADGDFAEKPMPEQYKTVIEGGKLVTVPVEHKG
ncbi:F-actin-capping protein subunit alpha [Borealophlyctis nickersoniae]|nr:F-actin-capping protein subunit alpha [Borealophlyctis nickersoniae]